MGRDIDPAHVAGGRRLEEAPGQRFQLTRTFTQACEIRAGFGDRERGRPRCLNGDEHRVQRRQEVLMCGAFVPAQLDRASHVAQRTCGGQSQLSRRILDLAGKLLPRLEPARLLQAGSQQVTREVDQCPAAQQRAEKVDARLTELMRLVENRQLDTGQQLGNAGVAQRHVGEEQVMVDDHQVGRHRFAPRLHDVALAIVRAFTAEAVLAR